MDHLSVGVTAGAIAVAGPLVIRVLLAGKTELRAGQLRYSRRWRLFATLMAIVPPILLLLAVAFQERPMRDDEWLPFSILLVFLPLLMAPVLIELRVDHSYDEAGWNYRSPWSRHRRLEWDKVARVRWRSIMKSLDVLPEGGERVFHLSPMLQGVEGLARIALERIPPAVLASADPDARAVLVLMAHGYSAALVMSPEPPAMMAARLEDH